MQYWHWLAIASLGFVILERVKPRRKAQNLIRPGIFTDLCYLVFNGHWVSVLIAMGTLHTARWFADAAGSLGLQEALYANHASDWPIWSQVLVAFIGLDFIRWCVHNLLHRVPWLWEFHKVHHSIVDLDWIGSFRFHWMEVIVYKAFQYLPLALLGFSSDVMMVHAVFSTVMGHFNHANLDVDIGPLKYIFNNPRMHAWHHDRDEIPLPPGVNFAIDFAIWDWLFKTAWMPETDRDPKRLGYEGIEKLGRSFATQLIHPLRLPWF